MLQWHSPGGMSYGASPIFLLHGNPYKTVLKHNKFLNSRKSYAIPHFTQRLCRWVFSGLCRLLRHKPFNLHYFRPYLFWQYLKKSCLSHFPNKAQIFHYGQTTSTSLLKSHTGATQALTGARESWVVCQKSKFVHYYLFLSVLVFWHKANSACF